MIASWSPDESLYFAAGLAAIAVSTIALMRVVSTLAAIADDFANRSYRNHCPDPFAPRCRKCQKMKLQQQRGDQ